MSGGHTVLVLAIYTLAVMRVVRLVNYDTVLDTVRARIAQRAAVARLAGEESAAAGHTTVAEMHNARMGRWNTLLHFMGCPWCVGFWVCAATAILPVLVIGWPWWAAPGVALAASYVVGAAAPLTADDDMAIVDVDQA